MGKGAAQKHLHSRISFLLQAATYLSSEAKTPNQDVDGVPAIDKDTAGQFPEVKRKDSNVNNEPGSIHDQGNASPAKATGLARLYVSQLKGISRRGVIRLSPDMKHAMCKRCDTVLKPGSTSTHRTENKSRGGRKPQADVFVICCNVCGTTKRFPIGAKRQGSKKDRVKTSGKALQDPGGKE